MPVLTKFIATTDVRDSNHTTINLDEREEHGAEEGINRDTEASIAYLHVRE